MGSKIRSYYTYKLDDGRIAVLTPYHTGFNSHVKKHFGGEWDAEGKAWIVDAKYEQELRDWCVFCFPSEDDLVMRVFTFTGVQLCSLPSIGGKPLFSIKAGRCGKIKHPDVVKVLENTLQVGGSGGKL
jgi:hypothetical protein